jgi:hypothetical protein
MLTLSAECPGPIRVPGGGRGHPRRLAAQAGHLAELIASSPAGGAGHQHQYPDGQRHRLRGRLALPGGGHAFFNPAPVMPLVEVARGQRPPTRRSRLVELAQKGKTPVITAIPPIHRQPGGLSVLRRSPAPPGRVAPSATSRSICSPGWERFPGPFELMDLIGIDVNLPRPRQCSRPAHSEPLSTSPHSGANGPARRAGEEGRSGFTDMSRAGGCGMTQSFRLSGPVAVWCCCPKATGRRA